MRKNPKSMSVRNNFNDNFNEKDATYINFE